MQDFGALDAAIDEVRLLIKSGYLFWLKFRNHER
jgi:hypothetical protein